MAVAKEEVAQQSQQTVRKNVNLINDCLDKLDKGLILRGQKDIEQQDENDPVGYYNLLNLHIQMLTIIYEKDIYKQEALVKSLNNLKAFFPLARLIKEVPAEHYSRVMKQIQKTLLSRIAYFSELRSALAMEQATPVDVAWFHRQNSKLVTIYLQEHPSNQGSLLQESEQVAKICDFKAFKFSAYANAQFICKKLANDARFFQNTAKRKAAQFYNDHLLTPLLEAANENTLLTTPRPLTSEMLEVYWYFTKQLTTLDTKFSAEEAKLIRIHADHYINLFFQNIFDKLKSFEDTEEADSNITASVVETLS